MIGLENCESEFKTEDFSHLQIKNITATKTRTTTNATTTPATTTTTTTTTTTSVC